MQQFKFYQALPLAFYSKPLYRDAANNWRGYGFLYALFLVCLLTLFFIAAAIYGRSLVLTSVKPIVSQMPTLTIQDGKVSTEKSAPYFITDSQKNETIAIIDTSGKTTSLDNSPASFLLTQDKLLFKKSSGNYQEFKLDKIKNGTYDQTRIFQLVTEFSYFVVFAFILVFFLFWLIKAIFIILLLAGITKLLTHTTLSFKALCRLASVAITPAVVLAIIFEIFRISIPFVILIYFALSVFYLFYGIEANKNNNSNAPLIT